MGHLEKPRSRCLGCWALQRVGSFRCSEIHVRGPWELQPLSQCPSEWLCNRLGPPGDGSHREEPGEAGHSPLTLSQPCFPSF